MMLGIPSPIKDTTGAGGWQAWHQGSVFSGVSANCSANIGDWNLAPFAWAWGFWNGMIPYPSHGAAGYNPFAPGTTSVRLAEFGVTRTGTTGVLPAFAFSMMPKMLPL